MRRPGHRPRREVLHLGPYRRTFNRDEIPLLRDGPEDANSVDVPFHLDEHEPELEPVIEIGDIVHADLPPGTVWERLAVLQELVAAKVAADMGNRWVPVVQSGCNTTALGVVAGMQRAGADPVVVWFDAHACLHTPESSPSGYPGGMVLRQLLGGGDRTCAERLGLRPVRERDVVLVGARDLDPAEEEFLAGSAVRRVGVDEVAGLLLPRRPCYLHVDFDVLDPAHVDGLRFPAPGGPTPERLGSALRAVQATGDVVAAGLACTWRRNVTQWPPVQGVGWGVYDRARG
ncbi:arginase family protein [Pseudonocardia lacus]|uniref:arginase family protein n=1 Tax=Pseudonocardia lacus TaxID=2835865 RepID=UPI001BDC58AD|nr:arginase family protein [Pseudonocardia lacus]